MEDTSLARLLLRLSPPVMLALLIQSVYNLVDSYFVARCSAPGLTALSIVFPLQLLMTAVATGTGAGLGILLAKADGAKNTEGQERLLKNGLFLSLVNYALFLLLGLSLVENYFALSSDQMEVQRQGVCYANIILIGSLGQFVEGVCTKILQAKGDMVRPMLAQITGALLNVVLDPLLIFEPTGLGIAGAALATVAGQTAAMLMTLSAVRKKYPIAGTLSLSLSRNIYQSGLPSIVMQSLYTLYIVGLNLILKQFTEDAVTVLGIYYKLQTFFFIPLMGLQQVILPVISYNYGAGNEARLKKLLQGTLLFSFALMLAATLAFWLFPAWLLSIFAAESLAGIGVHALHVISLSFIPAGAVMIFTVYYQGVDCGKKSLALTLLRQVCLLVPLAWLFHFAGLDYVWYTFPVTELITLLASLWLYRRI